MTFILLRGVSGPGYSSVKLGAFVQGSSRFEDYVYLLAVDVPIAAELKLPPTGQTRQISRTGKSHTIVDQNTNEEPPCTLRVCSIKPYTSYSSTSTKPGWQSGSGRAGLNMTSLTVVFLSSPCRFPVFGLLKHSIAKSFIRFAFSLNDCSGKYSIWSVLKYMSASHATTSSDISERILPSWPLGRIPVTLIWQIVSSVSLGHTATNSEVGGNRLLLPCDPAECWITYWLDSATEAGGSPIVRLSRSGWTQEIQGSRWMVWFDH